MATVDPARMQEYCSINDSGTLRLKDFDAVGFDLDSTLAKYDLTELFPLVFHSILEYLVKVKGYSDALLKGCYEKYRDLCFRGLIFDTARGNVLKVSAKGQILRATHGTTPMSSNDIIKQYDQDQYFLHTEAIFNHVNNIENDWIIFENIFDMPYGLAAARLVDILDEEAGHVIGEYDFWPDLQEAIYHLYNPQHFSLAKGNFFPTMKKEMDKRVSKLSEDIKKWLKNLREQKVITFMMTSSFIDYSILLMNYILQGDWQEYFDLYLCNAKKPGFFKKKNPFLRVDNQCEAGEVESIEGGHMYSQGNAQKLADFISGQTGHSVPKILYVGDSIRSDIFPSKKYMDWYNILILEELRAEGWNGSSDLYPQEKFHLTSDHWGSFFHDDLEPSSCIKYPNTLWARLIYSYADVVIPGLEYICHLPFDHEFRRFAGKKELNGFYPAPPSSLKY